MTNWTSLNKPIIGLAPMDGITDPAFREIADKYGHPDVLFTEFVSVEGLSHAAPSFLKQLRVPKKPKYPKSPTPTIAQLFGTNLKAYKKATQIVCELGFDGIDINMGCPDRNINKKGGGAALIGRPELAKDIIKTVKDVVLTYLPKHIIPVSVKTRTGLDVAITEKWIANLVEAHPDAITLHARTLIQMYRGDADWDEIAKVSSLIRQAGIVYLGNGDVKSVKQAREYSVKYRTDGVLIGRATLGNPWIFSGHDPSAQERLDMMVEHSQLYLKYRPELKLYPMRKHLAWYASGFEGSRQLRNELMKVVTMEDLQAVIKGFPA